MRTLTKFTSVLFIALASFAYTANASLILEWNSNSVSSNNPATGASAKATFDFFDDADFANNGLVWINMEIRNTTGEITPFGDGATTSKLTGIAFDLIANDGLDQANFMGGTYFDFMLTPALVPPNDPLDFGVADNDNFLGGNANNALPEGMQDSSSVKVDFNGLSSIQVEAAFKDGFMNSSLNYVARFQQVNGGNNIGASDKLNGGECCGNGGGGPDGPPNVLVPEPSTLFLLGSALLALSLRRKTY